ncbi:hypothetical protein NPIL_356781 [Nephila pilipes]|uniref:Uncharacterized protein n=1 Tax=Nephila pilipes TaxID=299642 RepID=A0A8X6N2L8_NEPPI|nr:hypothetical protein NPIL_356781 [Nephila pilipes]
MKRKRHKADRNTNCYSLKASLHLMSSGHASRSDASRMTHKCRKTRGYVIGRIAQKRNTLKRHRSLARLTTSLAEFQNDICYERVGNIQIKLIVTSLAGRRFKHILLERNFRYKYILESTKY